MKKFFNDLGALILIALVLSYYGASKTKPRRMKWSYFFVGIAILLLIVRVIWVALKG